MKQKGSQRKIRRKSKRHRIKQQLRTNPLLVHGSSEVFHHRIRGNEPQTPKEKRKPGDDKG